MFRIAPLCVLLVVLALTSAFSSNLQVPTTRRLSAYKSYSGSLNCRSSKLLDNFQSPVVIAQADMDQQKDKQTGVQSAAAVASQQTVPQKVSPIATKLIGTYGVVQVLVILGNAITRLTPIATQPFIKKDLQPIHWVAVGLWSLYMAYAEGYKAFHLKFSPMVVKRAFQIADSPSIAKIILAGPYSMGLFGASKKRMIISWAISLGVMAIVGVVKALPYPYRSIVDIGVVIGLSLGSLSIISKGVMALFGKLPDFDENEKKTN